MAGYFMTGDEVIDNLEKVWYEAGNGCRVYETLATAGDTEALGKFSE